MTTSPHLLDRRRVPMDSDRRHANVAVQPRHESGPATIPAHALHQLVDMTSLRDLELLDLSLLRNLHNQVRPDTLALLRIGTDQPLISEIRCEPNGDIVRNPKISVSTETERAILDLQEHDLPFVDIPSAGMQRTLFLTLNTTFSTTLLLIGSKGGLDHADRTIIETMLKFYRNFCALLLESQTDPLTGLANRKTFDDIVTRVHALKIEKHATDIEIERRDDSSRKSGEHADYWLVMVDIDHFKQVNDRYGHLYGDEVLVILAQQIRKILRTDDFAFRFGGEEFVLIVHCLSTGQARAALERLRLAVADMAIPQVGHITVSIGATLLAPDTFTGTLLDYADKALYHSKNTGRNKVTFFEDMLAQGLAQTEPQPEEHLDFF